MRLLLVEDERLIGDALRSALRPEGHAVDWFRDAPGEPGRRMVVLACVWPSGGSILR